VLVFPHLIGPRVYGVDGIILYLAGYLPVTVWILYLVHLCVTTLWEHLSGASMWFATR
jgi:hypothetical protein